MGSGADREPRQWAARWAVTLAAVGFLASAVLAPLIYPLFEIGPHNLGPLIGLFSYAPLGLVGGFLLGWVAALFFEQQRDVGVALAVVGVGYAAAIVVLPPWLNW